MPSTFRTDYSTYIVPKETTTLADGVDTVTVLNSQVDKTFSGSGAITVDNNTNVTATYVSTGANTQTLDTVLGTAWGWTDINLMFVKITSNSSAVSPQVDVKDNTVGICSLLANGDWLVLPHPTQNGGFTFTFNKADITIELYISGTVA